MLPANCRTLEQASDGARSPDVFEDLAQARDLAAGEAKAAPGAGEAIGSGASNAAVADEEVKELLAALAARRQQARRESDWAPLIWLSRAGEDLKARNVDLRPLLESHLTPDDVPDPNDLAKFRQALAQVRDTADPGDIADITAVLADYDDFARRVVSEVFDDVDASANRFPALANDVDGAAVYDELQDIQRQTVERLANVGDAASDEEIVAQAQMAVAQQDYLSAYNYAAKTITAGNDPVSRLDEEIAYVRYTIGVTDGADKRAALQARVGRLEDARNHVQRLIQVHSRLKARPPTDFRALRAADDWRFVRNSADLYRRRAATPAVVRFDGPSADLGTLEDRSLDASPGDLSAAGGRPPAEGSREGISQDGDYPRLPVRKPPAGEDDELPQVVDGVAALHRETLAALVNADRLSPHRLLPTSSPLADYVAPRPELPSGVLGRHRGGVAIRATFADPFVGGVLGELVDEGTGRSRWQCASRELAH